MRSLVFVFTLLLGSIFAPAHAATGQSVYGTWHAGTWQEPGRIARGYYLIDQGSFGLVMQCISTWTGAQVQAQVTVPAIITSTQITVLQTASHRVPSPDGDGECYAELSAAPATLSYSVSGDTLTLEYFGSTVTAQRI